MKTHWKPNARSARGFSASLVLALLALVMAVLVMTPSSAQNSGFQLDSAVTWNNGKYYFFKGDKYIRYDIETDRADAGYPLPIAQTWPGLPTSGIDAAVKWDDEKAYFFKGNQVIIYNMVKNEATLPLPLALISPFLQLQKIDAVVKWDNQKAYFFTDDKVVYLDLTNLKTTPPLPAVALFPGLTFTTIDATVNKNNEFIYFFSGDQYSRFNIKTGLVDPGYPRSVRSWSGLADEYWTAKTAYDDGKREYTTTFNYPREVKRAEPVGELKLDAEGFKDDTQLFRPVVVEKQTKQAYRANSTFFRFNLTPVVVRKKNDVVVSLTDTTDFNNACFVQQPHFVGYFLDSINVKYSNLTPSGWASPAWGPKTPINAGGYGHESAWNVNASIGFDGKTPQGSVAGGWSQSKSTSATIFDINFTANAPNSNPTFNWVIGQMYDGRDKPIAINNNNWWDAVRKTAGQVDITRSVYEAPDLAKTSFQPVSYAFYHPSSNGTLATASNQDMHILVEYDVAYRAVHTANLAKSDGDAFLRSFSLIFGANKDSYTGEAFRAWGTSVIHHKYAIEVVIPKEHLKPAPAG